MKLTPLIALMLLFSSHAFAFVTIAEGGDGGVTISGDTINLVLWDDSSETIFAKADLQTPAINFRVLRSNVDTICIEYSVLGTRQEECGSTAVNAGDWMHYGVVFNSTANTIQLYLNGSLEFNRGLAGNPDTTSQPITMARNTASVIQYYGAVDRARAYPQALNQTQIQADMVSKYQQTPAQYSWDFDLPSLTTAFDNHFADWNANWGAVMANSDYDDSIQCVTYDAPGDNYFESNLIRLILDNLLVLAALGILVFIGVAMVIRT